VKVCGSESLPCGQLHYVPSLLSVFERRKKLKTCSSSYKRYMRPAVRQRIIISMCRYAGSFVTHNCVGNREASTEGSVIVVSLWTCIPPRKEGLCS
jgi:hypothetical protein